MTSSSGPLSGLRVFDLSRIMAGPSCTQMLGDMGADVIKVERPGEGDDTRKWGPPFVKNKAGQDTSESAYYLSANRNKRSVSLDISQPEGQKLARQLISQCDILVENFKVGGLAKYGLSYENLKDEFPQLIYCSITGFGQTGPYAPQAGYDFLIQGMGGIMSLTGEPEGQPMKVGVAIVDLMCGMYASNAILAALHHRNMTGGSKSGEGQYIDVSLFDTQIAWLANQGLYYLTSGELPPRLGNGHPNIVPYNVVPSSDGHFILAIGNDGQYRKFCDFAGCPELIEDNRFSTNQNRIRNRDDLYPLIGEVTKTRSSADWIKNLPPLGVPCGPVNDMKGTFDHPQTTAREMKISMPHPEAASGSVDLIGSPMKFSRTPVDYRQAPPCMGEHTEEVLEELLQLGGEQLSALRKNNTV
ncbi:CaiB/BaiF CoA-transferase family protein [Kiloniella laminariae]|uniref:CaiB/BaiF CoA-transferase family protein n=1 Tax=Kiloniella laminariae TaxID=454162 RepID=A0ABT4LGX7_9PROT|nr:CaiB/BaiF CoA-transferase family protein [Kiloniella laminariae]MCZ4280344.1 CaiB/BaiF CoA-transferase family protein [Kiloniella laminariae]